MELFFFFYIWNVHITIVVINELLMKKNWRDGVWRRQTCSPQRICAANNWNARTIVGSPVTNELVIHEYLWLRYISDDDSLGKISCEYVIMIFDLRTSHNLKNYYSTKYVTACLSYANFHIIGFYIYLA